MNLLFWLLSGELILLAVSISLGLFIMNKRRENRLHEAVAKLLQSILDTEPKHLEQIHNDLMSRYPLSGKNKIEKLGKQIITEEREFFRELVRVLLTNDMNSLSSLHQPLHTLMNKQMDVLHQLGSTGITGTTDTSPATLADSDTSSAIDDDETLLDDDDMDALLQAATLTDDEEVEWVESEGDESTPTGTTTTDAPAATAPSPKLDEDDDALLDDDDDMAALLQAASLAGDDEVEWVESEGDESLMMTMPEESSTDKGMDMDMKDEDEEDDDMKALLEAASFAADLDEDAELFGGGDDSEAMDLSSATSANLEPSDEASLNNEMDALLQAAEQNEENDSAADQESAPALSLPPTDTAELPDDDDDMDALMQAAALAATLGDEADILVDGGNDEEAMLTEGTTEPPEKAGEIFDASALKAMTTAETTPAKAKPAAPRKKSKVQQASPEKSPEATDEFDALLNDLAKMEPAQTSADDSGMDGDQAASGNPLSGMDDEDLDLDMEDILNDLLLAEDAADEDSLMSNTDLQAMLETPDTESPPKSTEKKPGKKQPGSPTA